MRREFEVLVLPSSSTAELWRCLTKGKESPAQGEQRDNTGRESARQSANTIAGARGGAGLVSGGNPDGKGAPQT